MNREGGGVEEACNGFLGKTSFQWRLQNSINAGSESKEAEEEMMEEVMMELEVEVEMLDLD